MKRTLRALGLVALTAWIGGAVVAGAYPAQATGARTTPNGPTNGALCLKLGPWTVNGDELDRRPTATGAGLKFEDTDLIHHAASLPLADLQPGTFTTTGATPDQPSFFSVEVRNTGGAYGTLRWNPGTVKWSITIGAGTGPDGAATDGTFEGADPVTLLTGKVTKWGKFDVTTAKVVSFGVGYTKNPAGIVPVTVKSVTFKGTTYDLTCAPPPPTKPVTTSPSASASSSAPATTRPTTAPPTKPVTTSPSASATTTVTATTQPTTSPPADETTSATSVPGDLTGNDTDLPVTGPSLGIAVAGALVLVGTGAALFVITRRRKMNFTA